MLGTLALLALPLPAQVPPGSGSDDYNFGPLGAEGQPISKEEEKRIGLKRKETGLRVTRVVSGTIAEEAGLQVDDIILGTSLGALQRRYGDPANPIYDLTKALEAAESKKKGKLLLVVIRGEERKKLTVETTYVGPHARSCPRGCDKCEALYEVSLAKLASIQTEGGSMPMTTGGAGGAVVYTTLGGLAFLASGSTPTEGPYAENIVRCRDFILKTVRSDGPTLPRREDGKNWNQENWQLSYAPWFLCEYYNHTGDEEVYAKLEEIAGRLVQNMEPSGGWAHGPGGPNALGYVELEIMSNYAMVSFGCMRALGIEIEQKVVDKARDYVASCTGGDGGVAYSTRSGQIGYGEAGRSGGAYLAFARCGFQRHNLFAKMGKFTLRNIEKLPTGHVSPVMHFLAGAMCCWEMGPKAWKTYWSTFRTTFRSFRLPNGEYTAVPTAESQQLRSNADRGCGPGWISSTYLLIQGIPNDNLPILLPGKRKESERIRQPKREGTGVETGE